MQPASLLETYVQNVLNTRADTVSAFAVEWDGSLTPLGEFPVAATSVGIAAR